MPETDNSPSETVQHLVGIIVRGRWLVLLTTAIVALATVAVLYQMPNRYTSEATLLVVPQQVPARYVTPTTETNIADALQAMTQDVLSRARLLELIEQFGLYPKERQRLAPEEVIELMRKYIDIQPVDPSPGRKEINAFRISFVAEKPILAQEVTSKLTSFFIQANLKTREDQANSTTNFLGEALEAAKTKLTAQEARMRDFKTQYLGELPEQQPGNLAILSGAQLQLQNIAAGLDRAQQQRAYLESLLTGYRRLMSRGTPVSGIAGPDPARFATPLQIAQNELTHLEGERDNLLSTYRPEYPEVRALTRQIAVKQALVARMQGAKTPEDGNTPAPAGTARAAVESAEEDSSITQLKSQLESNRLEIDNLIKDEAQQKTVISQYQNRLNMTPVREQQLAAILRDYDLSKLDYADLLGKEQQSQLAANLEKQQGGQQFRQVEPPSLPSIPSTPKRIKMSLGGLGGGLLLGLAAAFIRNLLRPALYTPREVIQRFNAPLVIGIPIILTRKEIRRRSLKTKFELCGSSLLALAVCAAELYVLKHP